MSKNKGSSPRGAEGFEEYYSSIFAERWQALKAALLKESEPKAFKAQEGAAYFLDAASVLAAISLPLENAQNILDMCAAPGGKSLVLASRMERGASLRCNERSFDRFQRLKKVVAESEREHHGTRRGFRLVVGVHHEHRACGDEKHFVVQNECFDFGFF